MSEKNDAKEPSGPSVLTRLGLEALERAFPSGDGPKSLPERVFAGPVGPCPDHPLGPDLFAVLRSAHRA